jgi:hypothetical protein
LGNHLCDGSRISFGPLPGKAAHKTVVVSLAVAAATGAVLAAIFSSYPHRHPMCDNASNSVQETCIENPRAVHLAFSPWTRPRPGLINYPPVAMRDFIGSIIFGAVVGGALGFSFWFFHYRRSSHPENRHS